MSIGPRARLDVIRPMILPNSLERALKRLSDATAALELAAERRAEADAARGEADAEFAALEDDRARLASELDTALGRLDAVDRAAGEVSARLERVGATVKGVLADLATDERGRTA